MALNDESSDPRTSSSNSNDAIAGPSDSNLSGSGGNKTFVISLSDANNVTTIRDFGGMGTGIQPPKSVIAEADTIQFQGEGLTAENMLLTQTGEDLVISFQQTDNVKVVLKDFKLEDPDNLQKLTNASVDFSNILFDGQTEVYDSFDVINADWQPKTVFNPNTVTFLNDLDNKTQGLNDSNDVINGQGGNDTLEGLSGDDLLRGGTGDDFLLGGLGNDELHGDAGSDYLLGENKDDFLEGGAESDYLSGGSGNDFLDGGTDGDELYGGDGGDDLSGDDGDDKLSGDAGNDILSGGLDNDELYGGDGNDEVSGGNGNDYLYGEGGEPEQEGNDTLNGGAGNDILRGAAFEATNEGELIPGAPIPGLGEIDTLTGGTGSDLFILGDLLAHYDDGNSKTSGTEDYAQIVDFDTSEDVIQLQGVAGDYLLSSSPSGLPVGTAIFLNKPSGELDELIGIVQGDGDLSLNSGYFSFV